MFAVSLDLYLRLDSRMKFYFIFLRLSLVVKVVGHVLFRRGPESPHKPSDN